VMGETVPGASFTVGALRLPRATVAIFVGLAFGIAGTIFQTMLRNQLASPDIIGISASASAAGATGIIMFGLGQTAVSIMSTIASLVIALTIYLLSMKSGFTGDRKSTRLNSSHVSSSYAVFCWKKQINRNHY